MYKIEKKSDNRLDIDISGQLDSDSMTKLLDEFIAKSEGVEMGRMLYRIGDFSIPTLGAIMVELSQFPKLLKTVWKFDRCAVLCDTKWIRTAGDIEGWLIPGIDIKAFTNEEEEKAEQWLAKED